MVEELLKNPKRDQFINLEDPGDKNSLLHCVENGFVDLVDTLIAGGADVNHANVFGNTALLAATQIGSLDMVAALITAGADVNHGNGMDSKPFEVAIERNMYSLAFYLVKHGAVVTKKARAIYRLQDNLNPKFEDLLKNWEKYAPAKIEEEEEEETGETEGDNKQHEEL
eukprot:CAMPEP_0175150704 /NCGR_PEP_ID=MMETSP0087-20121206/18043_1 /TAXON_ID=136419 /ORGANISM="Unknown Unknown, Strain D1" /LENGTH=168 /DNA_ID=CAMNT_0016436729 /DNA_START=161 /DNA_END=667 /DNA_ORIENTATION=-